MDLLWPVSLILQNRLFNHHSSSYRCTTIQISIINLTPMCHHIVRHMVSVNHLVQVLARMVIDHLMKAQVVKDVLVVATENMRPEKLRLALICIMMQMLKLALKIQRMTALQERMKRVKEKVNLMNISMIVEIYFKIILV
ncbi:uncharacterized protein LOC132609171 [Lycium barbarum]|uniref:uncharacterized protein LOC132609171 n=1 Tax=Lycium barbarum TaxID=112863 RepID=UPI00293F3802|nr:uncharacterized protein LOC132609171 [Lycium barbarum]